LTTVELKLQFNGASHIPLTLTIQFCGVLSQWPISHDKLFTVAVPPYKSTLLEIFRGRDRNNLKRSISLTLCDLFRYRVISEVMLGPFSLENFFINSSKCYCLFWLDLTLNSSTRLIHKSIVDGRVPNLFVDD